MYMLYIILRIQCVYQVDGESKMRVFYGWYVLGGLFTVYAVSNGVTNFTLPLFYPSLMEEFGWDYEEIVRPASLKFIAAAFYSLIIGYLIDRYAPRPIMIIGASLMILGLVLYTFMSEITHFVAIYLFMGFGLSLCGLLPCMVLTSRWFTIHRGIAVGILLMASSVGASIFPLLIKGTLESGDWRQGAYILVIVSLVFLLLPIVWPIKSRPQDIGEVPDGKDNQSSSDKGDFKEKKVVGYYSGIAVSDAAKLPSFYLLLFATATLWFCISAMVHHQPIYLVKDIGLSKGDLAQVTSLFFFCSIIGKFSFGWLSDRVNKGAVMLMAITNLIIGLLILRFLEGLSLNIVYLYAIVYGIGFSGCFTMVQLMVAELFAGPTYGRILAIYLFVDTLISGLGTWLLGFIRNELGTYIPAIHLMLAMCVTAFVCVTILNKLTKKLAVASEAL
ncbi:MAG: hypothetical protein CBC47_03725 [Alphaproteobacteria bacterium TMED87]|nr:hypothetical protein [Rhodospirillaceae bacterium]OUV10213.1 MAG: hypothetical protein CBC47_03725 [Alphaproteobacteria bacterium TMED87]